MLDYASTLVAVAGVIGLAVMITMFFKLRARQGSSARILDSSGKSSVSQQTGVKADTSEPPPESAQPQSEDLVEKARDELRTLSLQRQITTHAMTAVFEAEAQGKISLVSRDLLVETHKSQLRSLDEQIAEKKKITEVTDLLNERGELVRSFEKRLAEIDERLQQLNAPSELAPPTVSLGNPSQQVANIPDPTITVDDKGDSRETKPKTRIKSLTEERIEAIREEVLKAMERLEQIESEG